jgi:hypothetical protein
MKKIFTLCFILAYITIFSQSTPEILYYKFDNPASSTNKIFNYASAPPAGADSATIMGGITQSASGHCGNALTGSGNSSSTDYLNTGFATSLPASWTISMWTSNITPSATLFYIFGDANAGSFRCFTNGVAGANNWILRGTGIADVYVYGGATVASHLTTFVFDQTTNNIYGYLDGVLVTTVAQGAPVISGSGPFKIMGYGTNVGSPTGGLLDEYRMYSRALNAAEIMDLYTMNISNTIAPLGCDSYTVPSGHATYTVSGTYLDTIPRALCGDSLLTINLTINSSSSSTQTVTTCDSYAWNSNTYTVSGTYTNTISNVAGCDSLMTLFLTINNSTSSSSSVTACDSFSWKSTTYTVSGTYTATTTNAIGCDSLITLFLTINNSPSAALALNPSAVCVTDGAYALSGGTPSGGTYSGIAVTGGNFDPATAGLGTFLITYSYTDANSCSDTDTASVTVNNGCTTGISKNNNTFYGNVYPNPFVTHTTIQINDVVSGAVLTVYDMQGKKVKQLENISGQSITLNRDSLQAGLYFIRLTQNNKVIFTDKILIGNE